MSIEEYTSTFIIIDKVLRKTSTMAPRNGDAKMYIDRQNEYLQRKKEVRKNRLKYLRKKVKKGTATKEEKKELKDLEK